MRLLCSRSTADRILAYFFSSVCRMACAWEQGSGQGSAWKMMMSHLPWSGWSGRASLSVHLQQRLLHGLHTSIASSWGWSSRMLPPNLSSASALGSFCRAQTAAIWVWKCLFSSVCRMG